MNEPPFPRHGGDLGFATARYGAPAGGWLDLSTGVNPHAYTAGATAPAGFDRLPDRMAVERLLGAARTAYSVPEQVPVVATPGTEVALRLLPLVAPAGDVAVVGPTYASHAEGWRNAGRQVAVVPSLEAADAAIVVVANPNNPDGRTVDPAALADVATRLARRGGLLVVDEAFADVAPDLSIVPRLGTTPAIVLRSFGKFYGLPGLRLGFVMGHTTVVSRLGALLGDWPVSTAAIAIGTAALTDGAWQTAMRARLGADAARLRTLLARHSLAVRGGTDLFVLVEDGDVTEIHERLARAGVWTRVFRDQPTWLRLGLPPDDAGFARLDAALSRG